MFSQSIVGSGKKIALQVTLSMLTSSGSEMTKCRPSMRIAAEDYLLTLESFLLMWCGNFFAFLIITFRQKCRHIDLVKNVVSNPFYPTYQQILYTFYFNRIQRIMKTKTLYKIVMSGYLQSFNKMNIWHFYWHWTFIIFHN